MEQNDETLFLLFSKNMIVNWRVDRVFVRETSQNENERSIHYGVS